jgi:hypothetical protein
MLIKLVISVRVKLDCQLPSQHKLRAYTRQQTHCKLTLVDCLIYVDIQVEQLIPTHYNNSLLLWIKSL